MQLQEVMSYLPSDFSDVVGDIVPFVVGGFFLGVGVALIGRVMGWSVHIFDRF